MLWSSECVDLTFPVDVLVKREDGAFRQSLVCVRLLQLFEAAGVCDVLAQLVRGLHLQELSQSSDVLHWVLKHRAEIAHEHNGCVPSMESYYSTSLSRQSPVLSIHAKRVVDVAIEEYLAFEEYTCLLD